MYHGVRDQSGRPVASLPHFQNGALFMYPHNRVLSITSLMEAVSGVISWINPSIYRSQHQRNTGNQVAMMLATYVSH